MIKILTDRNKSIPLYHLNPPRFPKNSVPGRNFFDTSMKYNKSALDFPNLLAELVSDGLTVNNPVAATHFLNNVSYFRFDSYLRVFEDSATPRHFKAGATFEQAAMIYSFDAELRSLLFSAIQKIEISLRSRIIHQFSLAHGPFWFYEPALAVDKHKFADNLSTLEREFKRSKEDFIGEHKKKYGDNDYPPAWKMLELASFGTLTKLYYNFSDTKVKKLIARSFGVTKPTALESWMMVINTLRNNCAHHSRVWNRKYIMLPQIPKQLPNKWLKNTDIAIDRSYAIFCCLAYWLNAVNPKNTFQSDFKILLAKYPTVDPSAMGFPIGWNKEKLWC